MGVEPFLLASSLWRGRPSAGGAGFAWNAGSPLPRMRQQLAALGFPRPKRKPVCIPRRLPSLQPLRVSRNGPGIYELLTVEQDLRRLIHDRASEQVLRDHVIKGGMRSLRDDGLRLAAQGVTSLERWCA